MEISKNVKIGITAQSDENLFGNGLKQNVWFLYRLLKNAGYDIHLVSESDKHYGKQLLGVPVEKLDTISILDFKVILQCANSLTETCRKILRGHGGKVGSCEYGNKILIDMGTRYMVVQVKIPLPCRTSTFIGHPLTLKEHQAHFQHFQKHL